MPENRDASDRLDSWKAIADYLQRDVATARRWEALGLPVRRLPGRGRSVFAYSAEIDEWLKAHSPTGRVGGDDRPTAVRPRIRGRLIGGFVTGAAAVLLGVVAWRACATPMPAMELSLDVSPYGVVASDRHGAERWRHPFASEYLAGFSEFGTRSQVVAGPPSMAFAATGFRVRKADNVVEGGELMAFSPQGSLEHTFRFDDHVTFDRKDYGPPWGLTAFAVEEHTSAPRIAIAAHHYLWSASTVTLLDAHWRRLGTYWQWGWIEDVRWLAPNRLLIAGFNDGEDGGMVALLDPQQLNGQSPAPRDTHGFCNSCGPDLPLRMVVMPRSELNRATSSRFNRAFIQLFPDRIVAHTIEMPVTTGDAVDALYEFSPGLNVLRGSFSGPYWDLHRTLHARGVIDHDRANCLDRDGPSVVLTWDRVEGWQTIRLNSSR